MDYQHLSLHLVSPAQSHNILSLAPCNENFAITLSTHFELSLKIVLHRKSQITAILAKPTMIVFETIAQVSYLHGFVESICYEAGDQSANCHFVSPLFQLQQLEHIRAYYSKTVVDIIVDILQQADIQHYQFQIEKQYWKLPLIVQYQQRDDEFLMSLLAQFGLFYYFLHQEKQAILVITDKLDRQSRVKGTLKFQQSHQLNIPCDWIMNLHAKISCQPESVIVNDYNHHQPSEDLKGYSTNQTTIKGFGNYYRYGENYQTLAQGEFFAEIRRQAFDARRLIFFGKSADPHLREGDKILIVDHPYQNFNGQYFIIGIWHMADPQGECFSYYNQLCLLPASSAFRLLPPKLPKYFYFTGTITGDQFSSVTLDEYGYYRVTYDFIEQSIGDNHYQARLLQQAVGIHYPLRPGTPVILACINGDINRPVIIGVIPNDQVADVQLLKQNRLKNHVDQQCLFQDLGACQLIDISTFGRQQSMTLSKQRERAYFYLQNIRGDVHLSSAKSITFNCQENFCHKIGGKYAITIADDFSLMTHYQDIFIQADTAKVTCAKSSYFISQQKDIKIKAQACVTVDSCNDLIASTTRGDLSAHAVAGNMALNSATGLTVSSDQELVIKQGSSSIQITADGEIIFNSQRLDISAKQIISDSQIVSFR